MWVATKPLKGPAFQVEPGMPIPHQGHARFRERLKELFGADCLRWTEGVSTEELRKVRHELNGLRQENARLKGQYKHLLTRLEALTGKKTAA